MSVGQPIAALQSRVEVEAHLRFEWRAFADLSTDRPVGMGVRPIPWSCIDRYARRYGIDDLDDFEAFLSLMRAMDAVHLDHVASLQTKE